MKIFFFFVIASVLIVACKKESASTPARPQSPTMLSAQKYSPDMIRLTWTDNADNELGFKIERRTGATGLFKEIAVVGKDAAEYVDRTMPVDTTYTYRVYAYNDGGMSFAYSNEANSDSYIGKKPYAETVYANQILGKSANLTAYVNPNYSTTSVTVEYGETLAYGYIQTGSPNYLYGGSNISTGRMVAELKGKTLYHFRVRAENSFGVAYGADKTFTTLGELPYARTEDATNITSTTVLMNGLVHPNFLRTSVGVEFGTTTSYGLLIPYSSIPENQDSTRISVPMTALQPNTEYHFRVRAENELGVVYGTDKLFKTNN